MPRLKSFKSSSLDHDQVSPTTAWARMVAILAAVKKKAELDLKRRRKQPAVYQQASSLRRTQQTAKQPVSSRRRTQQPAA